MNNMAADGHRHTAGDSTGTGVISKTNVEWTCTEPPGRLDNYMISDDGFRLLHRRQH